MCTRSINYHSICNHFLSEIILHFQGSRMYSKYFMIPLQPALHRNNANVLFKHTSPCFRLSFLCKFCQCVQRMFLKKNYSKQSKLVLSWPSVQLIGGILLEYLPALLVRSCFHGRTLHKYLACRRVWFSFPMPIFLGVLVSQYASFKLGRRLRILTKIKREYKLAQYNWTVWYVSILFDVVVINMKVLYISVYILV